MDSIEKAFLLIKLCNLGSNRVAHGQLDFLPRVMELYRSGVEEQLLVQKGTIDSDVFLNICILGAQAQTHEWVQGFIDTYQHFLLSESKAVVLAQSRSYLLFHQNEFLAARNLLNEVHSSKLVYTLRIQSMSVRCLLELVLSDTGYEPVLHSKLVSFKAVLSKGKLQVQRKKAYLHFVAAVKEIADYKSKTPRNIQKYDALYKNVNAYDPLVLKAWLQQKLVQIQP